MPRLAAFFLFVVLSSMGLPMLNGFVGEYLILLGTYQVHWTLGGLGRDGRDSLRVLYLWSYQRVFFGDVTQPENRELPDVTTREKWIWRRWRS